MGLLTIDPAIGAKTRVNTSTRIVSSTLAGVISAAAVMHGIYEILQGGIHADSLVFNAIGPDQRMWEFAALHAFSVAGDVTLTGVIAIVLGATGTVWAVRFLDRPRGPLIMAVLSLALFLFGGGFGPLVVGLFAAGLATRIHAPLTWWRRHLPERTRRFAARIWPGIMLVYLALFLGSVVATITGWPLLLVFTPETVGSVTQNVVGGFQLAVMLTAVVAAFAHDIEQAPWAGEH